LDKDLWIEAIAASGAVRDIEIWEGYQDAQGNLKDGLDKVKATAVWVENTDVANTNSAPLWSDADGGDITNTFTNGLGKFGFNPSSPLGKIVQGIGFEFTVKPDGVGAEPGVKFDVTRQMEQKYFQFNGATWAPLAQPWETFKIKDESNDDSHQSDEDNTPKNNHIYSLDAPGLFNRGTLDQFVGKLNFKEFCRVRFDGIEPSGNTSEGSRCSLKLTWHAHCWYQGNGTGYTQVPGKTNSVGIGHLSLGSNTQP
jgi:hypothetical protein